MCADVWSDPLLSAIVLSGCETLLIPDTSSLFFPGFQKSKFLGSWLDWERPSPGYPI